jgi:hypothetical protein
MTGVCEHDGDRATCPPCHNARTPGPVPRRAPLRSGAVLAAFEGRLSCGPRIHATTDGWVCDDEDCQ